MTRPLPANYAHLGRRPGTGRFTTCTDAEAVPTATVEALTSRTAARAVVRPDMAGEHACDAAGIPLGVCEVPTPHAKQVEVGACRRLCPEPRQASVTCSARLRVPIGTELQHQPRYRVPTLATTSFAYPSRNASSPMLLKSASGVAACATALSPGPPCQQR